MNVTMAGRLFWPVASRFGRMLSAFVIALFGIAGTLKLLDLQTFYGSLKTWEYIPGAARVAIAVTVPALELGVFLLFFLTRHKYGAIISSIVLLVLFSGFYLYHVVFSTTPDCGCFGKVALYFESQRSAQGILVRNAVLLAVLITGAFGYRAKRQAYSCIAPS